MKVLIKFFLLCLFFALLCLGVIVLKDFSVGDSIWRFLLEKYDEGKKTFFGEETTSIPEFRREGGAFVPEEPSSETPPLSKEDSHPKDVQSVKTTVKRFQKTLPRREVKNNREKTGLVTFPLVLHMPRSILEELIKSGKAKVKPKLEWESEYSHLLVFQISEGFLFLNPPLASEILKQWKNENYARRYLIFKKTDKIFFELKTEGEYLKEKELRNKIGDCVDFIDFFQESCEELKCSFAEDNIAFLLALAYVESRCEMVVISPKGAVGLFQVMPSTAAKYGVNELEELMRPKINTRVAIMLLNDLFNRYKSAEAMLEAYFAGHQSNDPSVKKYVKDVLTLYEEIRRGY